MPRRVDLFHIIQPKHLYIASGFFTGLILVLVVAIYFLLYRKKNRFLRRELISSKLLDCISHILIEGMDAPDVDVMMAEVVALLDTKIARQVAIDQLVNTKKNVLGKAAESIVELYVKMGLRGESVRKFRSRVWHLKARGIYELYMMDQREFELEIAAYSNSPDEIVRMEAQVASLGFYGFNGLGFLNTLKYRLTGWQQVKLLEQLQLRNPEEMPDLPLWIRSSNKDVVLFALKLADVYQQFGVYQAVVHCLTDRSEKIRRQAVQTLGRIAQDDTSSALIARYARETLLVKESILRQLETIGNEKDLAFLLDIAQNDPDDMLRLYAQRAAAQCSADGKWSVHMQKGAVMNGAVEISHLETGRKK